MESKNFHHFFTNLDIIGDVEQEVIFLAYSVKKYVPHLNLTGIDELTFNLLVNEETGLTINVLPTLSGKDERSVFSRTFQYPTADAVLCLFSLIDPPALEKIENYYIPELRRINKDVPIILGGVDMEQRDNFDPSAHGPECRPISTEEAREVAERIGAKEYIECSPSQFQNLDKLFETAAQISFDYSISKNQNQNEKEKGKRKAKTKESCLIA